MAFSMGVIHSPLTSRPGMILQVLAVKFHLPGLFLIVWGQGSSRCFVEDSGVFVNLAQKIIQIFRSALDMK